MPTARDILRSKKTGGVITVPPDSTVREACAVMRDRNVGALVVFDGASYVGIITDRDVVKRVVAEGRDAGAIPVSDVMTAKVNAVLGDATIDQVEALMRQERIRHVVVVGEPGVVGIVSIGDVAAFNALQDQQTVQYLTEYIHGRA